MERLTNADINELTYWHSTPAPACVAGHLVAQTYEPHFGSGYDPSTDTRLEKMVQAGISRSQSEWQRVKNVLDLVADGENGRRHVEILRRAFGPLTAHALPTKDFFYPDVAIVTSIALSKARELAVDEEGWRLLSAAWTSSLRNGDSPMTVAQRVLETSDRVEASGVVVTDDVVRWTTRRNLERATSGPEKKEPANVAFCADVRAEMYELVASSGDAYRRARKALGATRRGAKEVGRKERQALLDEAMGKNRAKETAKYNAKIRRAS